MLHRNDIEINKIRSFVYINGNFGRPPLSTDMPNKNTNKCKTIKFFFRRKCFDTRLGWVETIFQEGTTIFSRENKNLVLSFGLKVDAIFIFIL